MKVTVMGGGIAGLIAGLMLAADGHEITVIERDPFEVGEARSAFECKRRGVAQFYQPHAFLPRGRKLLRQLLPAVYASLLGEGATEIDVLKNIGNPDPGQSDIIYLAARRPLIEWSLRDAVVRSSCMHRSAKVKGLLASGSGAIRVHGVVLEDGTEIASELVVDAMGRTSPVPRWLADLGTTIPRETAPVGCVYYSRYFKLRPGTSLCSANWPIGPRGDLGFAAYATFPGDNDTFGVAIMPAAEDAEFRLLKVESAFEAACTSIGPLAEIMGNVMQEPITAVMPMGALQNTFHHFEASETDGLLPMGDTYFHTDPTFALGLSNALIHGEALMTSLRLHAGDTRAVSKSYFGAITPEAEERFRLSCDFDAARSRSWKGEKLDFTSPAGCYPLFAFAAAAMASRYDPAVQHAFWRRMGYLDRSRVFDDDQALHQRIEQVVKNTAATNPRPASPSRKEFLALLKSASETAANDRSYGGWSSATSSATAPPH